MAREAVVNLKLLMLCDQPDKRFDQVRVEMFPRVVSDILDHLFGLPGLG